MRGQYIYKEWTNRSRGTLTWKVFSNQWEDSIQGIGQWEQMTSHLKNILQTMRGQYTRNGPIGAEERSPEEFSPTYERIVYKELANGSRRALTWRMFSSLVASVAKVGRLSDSCCQQSSIITYLRIIIDMMTIMFFCRDLHVSWPSWSFKGTVAREFCFNWDCGGIE